MDRIMRNDRERRRRRRDREQEEEIAAIRHLWHIESAASISVSSGLEETRNKTGRISSTTIILDKIR
jgi:hypothetical protein